MGNRWVVVAIFAALFVALFAIVGVAIGIGHPSVPDGAVAVVEDAPNGTISKADFDAALVQSAARQGLPKPPSPSSPQYATLRDAAMSSVLLSRWILGEAQERGIVISDTEIQNQLKQIATQQFGGEKKFQQYLKQAGFSPQQAHDTVEQSLITTQLQDQVVPKSPTLSSGQIESFYEANRSQFSQPETRDVREIVNKDQAKVEQAKALLEKDDSSKSWDTVAAKYSTDSATKDNGGLRKGVTTGQSDPAIDSQIFSASQGPLIGPIKGQKSYYLIQVVKITPASTTPLSQVSTQIKQQLTQGLQQEAATDFQTKFVDKWTQRSFCASGYVVDRCANFTAQDACTGDDPGESGNLDKTGCDAFVASTAPVAPGSATVFPGQPSQAAPQGPQTFAAPTSTQQLPPGVIGPGGAPQQVPPGAAPQTTSPGG
jgi:parvulin-like peptidyl-prolyl isomerase